MSESSAPGTTRPRKHPKHLMVPGQPRPAAPRGSMTLSTVQKWVLSTLAVSTVLHLAGGLVLAAKYVDERSSTIGLLVIAALMGMLGMLVGLLIHRARPLHPLLLAGLLPAALGTWWIFG
ncbi:hypothetical protein [Nocardioides caldifontis]|uniref:hypothetical protein n=1 Tax=Nocardioides caldifontis TaxID=2588938 RepID=UPI0011DFD98E|nr:hypothetical protein [Nocardioides caldifontis]